MKRSEVLRSLETYVNRIRKTNHQTVPEYAEEILVQIEKLGMLPPEIKEKGWKIKPSGEMVYGVYEWDEE